MSRVSRSKWSCSLVSTLVLVVAAASARGASLRAALVPGSTTVAAGDEFELRIRVLDTGLEFNGYEAYIDYDPAALTFLPATPLSLQEGPYMTGACNNTFHYFREMPPQLRVSHSLLCQNLVLTGPGDLYALRFRATGAPGTTAIGFADLRFYRGGWPVQLETPTGATIDITSPTDVVPALPSLRLEVAPNPFNPTTVITVHAPGPGWQRLVAHDLRGRLMRVLQEGTFAAGTRRVVWTGDDATGERLPSGVYVLTLESGLVTASQRVVLVK